MNRNQHPTKLVFFSSKQDEHYINISSSVPDDFPKDQIFNYDNLNDFSIAIRDTLYGLDIIMIIARCEEELKNIFKMSEGLKDHSIVLILDNSIGDMMQQVMQLYPRYICFTKKDYTDIFLVLKKMIINIQNKIKGEEYDRRNRYY